MCVLVTLVSAPLVSQQNGEEGVMESLLKTMGEQEEAARGSSRGQVELVVLVLERG